MEEERSIAEQSRAIFLTNGFEVVKSHYKALKELALKSNPSDKNYIEYLELDFNTAIEHFIKEASIIG